MAFWEVLFDITKNLMYSYLNVRWVLFENFISRLDWNFSYACSVDRLRLAGLSQGGNGVWCASLWSPLSFPRCQRFEINTNEPCPCKCCDKTPITNLRTAPHELSTLSWFRFRRFRGGNYSGTKLHSLFSAILVVATELLLLLGAACVGVCVKVGVCVCVVHFRACCWSLALPQLNSQLTVEWCSENIAQNAKE